MTTPTTAPTAEAVAGRTRRGVLAVAVTGTVAIGLGAFWLSFTSLSDLARRCGIGADRAWVWPLLVDGVIVIATVSVVALTGTGQSGRAARYPWTLLLAAAGVSVLANASHAMVAADARVPAILAALVAAVPPVVLVATTHLTVQLTHHPAPADRADRDATDAIETHVRSSATRGAPDASRGDRSTGGAAPEALRLRETGLTNRQIAARLGVHPSTVGRWFKPQPAHQTAHVPSAATTPGPRVSPIPALPEATQTTKNETATTERSPAP